MLQSLYSQWKSSSYPLYGRLGEFQSRSGHVSEEKNTQPLPELEPRSSKPYSLIKVNSAVIIYQTSTHKHTKVQKPFNKSKTLTRFTYFSKCISKAKGRKKKNRKEMNAEGNKEKEIRKEGMNI